jgi:pyrroline-5-carboxylate reductase
MSPYALGFLGFGNMAAAIARGTLAQALFGPGDLAAHDLDPARMNEARSMGVDAAAGPADLAGSCKRLMLAVKPQNMTEAIEPIVEAIPADCLVISIAAGIPIKKLEDHLGEDRRIARIMPNTPALVGVGAAGAAFNAHCTDEDAAFVKECFQALGVVELVAEDQLDAVTALSGSGPAYFFYLVEAMVDAAAKLGLGKDQAVRLASQTCLGAGQLLMEAGESPAVLRSRVTSKGGTTAAALQVFHDKAFPEMVEAAMQAAHDRSKELGG